MQAAFTLLTGDVSISPENVMHKVCSHEQEQVINAYKKASFGYGTVLQSSVRLKPNIYPEYGRSYISGDETNIQMKYYNEDNPYQQDLIKQNSISYIGKNIDLSL